MHEFFLFIILILVYFIFPAYATPANRTHYQPITWYLGGSISAITPHISDSHKLFYTSPANIPLGTLKTNNVNTTPRMTILGGYTFSGSRRWWPGYQLGIELWQMASTSAKGQWIDETLGPPFTTYNYQYAIKATGVALTANINIINYRRITPFFGVNIGYTWIKSENFQVLGDSSRDFSFKSATTHHAYYAVKLGTWYQLAPQTKLGLWYAYENLGKVAVGNGYTPTNTAQAPGFSDTLHNQNVNLSIIHVF